ncbi:Rare lipoprotein A precursor [Rhodovastum atsumiense]|uniref:septal ring lytic transglycosylase RlpA family protein n=1 Tax=Rhodovastum atsumiense TaxID=504468 RepID=UPI00139F2B66|nr:SPOR domain-containing protein [Rhodovastum atsumiense]CAH2604316.1 Rare lipoprotein A precursor [Rhodovastum atsumiense]
MTQAARLLPVLLLAACVGGCHTGPRQAAPQPGRYVVGEPYQTGGLWRYPREQFEYADTGLAAVAGAHAPQTANGETYDPTALAAGHRTLQLPALARVTSLETGRAVLVRINDRGPADPGRLIELTPRAAELLGGGKGPLRVRVQLLEAESRAMAGALAEVPLLSVATAPRGGVQAESLAPPPGARQAVRVRGAAAGPVAQATGNAAVPTVPLRLPEQVWQQPADPGLLYIECGSFARLEYARVMQHTLAGLGPQVSTDYNAPRERAFRVRIGPFADTTQADAMLDRTLRAGVSDARIVVDSR